MYHKDIQNRLNIHSDLMQLIDYFQNRSEYFENIKIQNFNVSDFSDQVIENGVDNYEFPYSSNK